MICLESRAILKFSNNLILQIPRRLTNLTDWSKKLAVNKCTNCTLPYLITTAVIVNITATIATIDTAVVIVNDANNGTTFSIKTLSLIHI